MFKHQSGNSYQFRCMKLDYDDYNHVYCWVPFDSGICSFFDTAEKTVEEAKKALSIKIISNTKETH